MTFTLYGTTFVDGNTPVPAAFLNKVRTELPSAVDGRGGSYTPVTNLDIQGAGADIIIGGDQLVRMTPTGGTQIETAVRFDSTVLINSSAWPTFSSRTHNTRWHHPVVQAHSLAAGTISGGIVSGKSVLALPLQTVAGDVLLDVPEGPQGSSIVAVYVVTIGLSGLGAGTLTYPTYTLQRVAYGTAGSATLGALATLSTATADEHTPANWETDWLATTITATGSPAYVESSKYQLKVEAPFNSADNAGLYIAAIAARYNLTSLRPQ